MTSRGVTILVVEDEDSIGEAIRYQLSGDGFDVVWTKDGTSALQVFRTRALDLVILDLMLPGISGEDLCKTIRQSSTVPIIMLTAKDSEVDRILGLELGADDYVTKPFSTRELLARVRAVLRRTSDGIGTEIRHAGRITLNSDRREVTVEGRPVHLTPKEFELLEILMENPGKVLRREYLLEHVWGFDFVGDSRTLDVHIKRLRAKCEPDPANPRHLVTVRGVGYRFER